MTTFERDTLRELTHHMGLGNKLEGDVGTDTSIQGEVNKRQFFYRAASSRPLGRTPLANQRNVWSGIVRLLSMSEVLLGFDISLIHINT